MVRIDLSAAVSISIVPWVLLYLNYSLLSKIKHSKLSIMLKRLNKIPIIRIQSAIPYAGRWKEMEIINTISPR